MALLLFPEGHLLPPEGSSLLASQPTEQTCCTTASSDGRMTGKLKLVAEGYISSGISVIERGLWGSQKHHSTWLCPASPMNVAMGQQWPLWSTGGAG